MSSAASKKLLGIVVDDLKEGAREGEGEKFVCQQQKSFEVSFFWRDSWRIMREDSGR
jgi:hypothetical protein